MVHPTADRGTFLMNLSKETIYTLQLDQKELDDLTENISELENQRRLNPSTQKIFNNLVTYYLK